MRTQGRRFPFQNLGTVASRVFLLCDVSSNVSRLLNNVRGDHGGSVSDIRAIFGHSAICRRVPRRLDALARAHYMLPHYTLCLYCTPRLQFGAVACLSRELLEVSLFISSSVRSLPSTEIRHSKPTRLAAPTSIRIFEVTMFYAKYHKHSGSQVSAHKFRRIDLS